MKRYRLLKDSPYVKAGAVFVREIIRATEIMVLESQKEERPGLIIDKIMDFDEWFEEIKEPKWAYHINDHGDSISCIRVGSLPSSERYLKEIGNYFETREEAEKYLEYLKAKAIIKQDAKGFKPDWNDKYKPKYWGYWNFYNNKLDNNFTFLSKSKDIYFKSKEDIEESFKKHPKEWKTYLFYEQ